MKKAFFAGLMILASLALSCQTKPDVSNQAAPAGSNSAALRSLLREAASETQRWGGGNEDPYRDMTVYSFDPEKTSVDELLQAVQDAGFVQVWSGEEARDWDLDRGVLRWCVSPDPKKWDNELRFSAVGETTVHKYGFSGAVAALAEEMNAAKPGGTVTLSGRVELTTALTVPKGVTLDLTAEGAALELRDGAILTVNGTVNATGHGDHGKGWIEGSLRMGDGTAVIDGTGTIKLKSKGRLLNIGSDKGKRKFTLDGVTLVGLPDNDSPLVGIYENGEFVLKSGAITGNTFTGNEWAYGGGVEVSNGGTFTMDGGEISGNSVNGKYGSDGGGVQISEGSVFTISGGEITGNTAVSDKYASGGGVKVRQGTFTMAGGEISGNSVKGGTGAGGGGVTLDRGTFTMTGGTITGNTVTAGSDSANGGGVSVSRYNAVFTMSGGTISGNTLTGGRLCLGAGVSLGLGLPEEAEPSTFIMQGGAISGNTATGGRDRNDAGGVYINAGIFILEGGTIYGKADSLPAGTDASLANSAQRYGSLQTNGQGTVKWGAGGTYTKGGASQTGGSAIGGTDDTLIAVPGK